MARPQQLVSQWQSRLATAERLAVGTPRFRWLHLARVRLYRFLLSCYGSGQWRTGLHDDQPQPLVVEDAAEFSSATGKPPKAVGKIQAVLKSVQNAQDHPPQSGPWTDGIDPATFMAVTDNEARINVVRCREFLCQHGLSARILGRGRQRVVVVPYAELATAAALVDANRAKLRMDRKLLAIALPRRPVFKDETRTVAAGILWVLFLASGIVMIAAMAVPVSELGFGAAIGLLIAAVVAVVEACTVIFLLFPRRWPTLSIDIPRELVRATKLTLIAVPITVVISAAFWFDGGLGQLAIYLAILMAVILFGDRFVRR